ncbi:hypothetical protein Bca52824_048590 [Brassica carinata]|uniref:Uncharacterized protein n=1 Tax=Brassica carinata TaxID=52824 RepID=A0A8X7RIP6_BRACI|nr:hypothetical protein Bca52824_048590 [Brassica carinata]
MSTIARYKRTRDLCGESGCGLTKMWAVVVAASHEIQQDFRDVGYRYRSLCVITSSLKLLNRKWMSASKIPSMSTSSSSDGASYVDMLYAVNDSNFGIPDRCPCGSVIIIQISTVAAAIPKKYFNDGLHKKQEWTAAIEDETRHLKKTVDDHKSRIRSLGRVEYQIDRIDEDAQKNDGEIANLGYQIHEMDKVLKKNTGEIALLKEIIAKL